MVVVVHSGCGGCRKARDAVPYKCLSTPLSVCVIPLVPYSLLFAKPCCVDDLVKPTDRWVATKVIWSTTITASIVYDVVKFKPTIG